MYKRKVLLIAVLSLVFAITGISLGASDPAKTNLSQNTRSKLLGSELRKLHQEVGRSLTQKKTISIDDIQKFVNRFQQLEFRINHVGLQDSVELSREQKFLEKRIEQLKQESTGLSAKDEMRGKKGQPFSPLRTAPQRHVALASAAAPSNDPCENATSIVEGSYTGDTCSATNDGSESCVGSFSPDVWFKYTAQANGPITANTQGSEFDTVLSVHTACPGTAANEVACSDDCIGLESCVTIDAVVGTTYLFRLAGYGEGTAGSYALNLSAGAITSGSISGTVTDTETGSPLVDTEIDLFDSSGDYVGGAYTDASGNYAVTNLYTGTYFAVTYSYEGYMDELYDNIPCAGGCDPTTGTPISVQLGANTPDINFALDPGATISGSITDANTGTPISADVYVFDSNGDIVSYGYSDESGNYTAAGLPAGTFFAVTSSYDGYLDELYDNLPCDDGVCDATTGTPIQVAASEDVTGIDFALTSGGRIAGTVTDAKTEKPLIDTEVDIFDSEGNWAGYDYTNDQGKYVVGGLTTGSYFAITYSYGGNNIDELYSNIPCAGGGCDVLGGTPIAVTVASKTGNIDFALDRGGRIFGKVSDENTGNSIPYAEIYVVNSEGETVAYGYTNSKGKYTIIGLPTGTYFAVAERYSYLGELYGGLPCAGSECNPLDGTPIPVTAGSKTKKINFELGHGGSISGTVTDLSGDFIVDTAIEIYDANGMYAAYAYVDSSGLFRAEGLATGTYFARTFNYDGYGDELFDNLPCNGTCDVTAGAPIPVTAGAETPGINFQLVQGGNISGTITDADNGKPLNQVEIDIFDSNGTFATDAYAWSCGRWITYGGLAPGVYFARTHNEQGFLDELYNNIPCPDGSCNPVEGSPIVVTSGSTISGIDFDLNHPVN